MSILVDKNANVITQGMTGDTGTLARLLRVPAIALALIAAPLNAQHFTTTPVTIEMVTAAVAECRWQLEAEAFDYARLTDAGWVSAIRSQGGEGETNLQGFRHAETMMLLTTIDEVEGPDKCVVMAPTGPAISVDAVRSAMTEQLGSSPSSDSASAKWDFETITVLLGAMNGGAGVEIEMQAKEI